MAKGDRGHPRMSADFPEIGTVQEEAKGLKDKAQEMASNLGEKAGQMRDKARTLASDVAEQAGERWRGATEGAQQQFESMRHRAEGFWGDATDFIRRYPAASLAIAFGLGCMTSCAVSFLMHSTTDDVAQRMSRASS